MSRGSSKEGLAERKETKGRTFKTPFPAHLFAAIFFLPSLSTHFSVSCITLAVFRARAQSECVAGARERRGREALQRAGDGCRPRG